MAISSYNDNDDTHLKGATDETLIGNVADSLKTTVTQSALPTGASTSALQTTGNTSLSSIDTKNPSLIAGRVPVGVAYSGNKISLSDMNASNGGVARDTAITSTTVYTNVFSYTGSGHLFSFLTTLEGALTGADIYNIRLTIDSTVVFDLSTADIGTATLYNLGSTFDEFSMGISLVSNTFRYKVPQGGLYFASNVSVSIKRAASGSKRFRAGLVHLTKET